MNKYIYLNADQVPHHLRGEYRGKTFRAVITDSVTIPAYEGNWGGGSRTVKSVIDLATGQAMRVTDTVSAPWDKSRQNGDRIIELRPGLAVVESSTFRGKDMGLTFYMVAADVAPMLPAPVELTDCERMVLKATAQYKSSYGGMNRYDMARRDAIGYLPSDEQVATFPTVEQWESAKSALIERKLLNKRGAITPAGRNAVA